MIKNIKINLGGNMLKIILCLISNLIFTNISDAKISIVAIVNGKPITSYELEQKIKLEK